MSSKKINMNELITAVKNTAENLLRVNKKSQKKETLTYKKSKGGQYDLFIGGGIRVALRQNDVDKIKEILDNKENNPEGQAGKVEALKGSLIQKMRENQTSIIGEKSEENINMYDPEALKKFETFAKKVEDHFHPKTDGKYDILEKPDINNVYKYEIFSFSTENNEIESSATLNIDQDIYVLNIFKLFHNLYEMANGDNSRRIKGDFDTVEQKKADNDGDQGGGNMKGGASDQQYFYEHIDNYINNRDTPSGRDTLIILNETLKKDKKSLTELMEKYGIVQPTIKKGSKISREINKETGIQDQISGQRLYPQSMSNGPLMITYNDGLIKSINDGYLASFKKFGKIYEIDIANGYILLNIAKELSAPVEKDGFTTSKTYTAIQADLNKFNLKLNDLHTKMQAVGAKTAVGENKQAEEKIAIQAIQSLMSEFKNVITEIYTKYQHFIRPDGKYSQYAIKPELTADIGFNGKDTFNKRDGGAPIKYKSTGQVVFIMYEKKKYKRTIYVKEKRNTKYCKINNEYILLSKLKVIGQ